MTIPRYLAALILVAGLYATAGQAADTPDWNALTAKLDAELKAAEARDEFSGAILLAVGDTVLYTNAFGHAHRGHRVPNRVDTKFNLGSVDKQFTMVAVMRQVAAGAINLDTTVGTYLPDWPNRDVAESVTVRHLLTHTSGMGFYWTETLFREIGRFRTLQDYAGLFVDEPLAFRPGESWAYSNNGYIMLGLILEAVTGESYHDHIAEIILRPLDMENTGAFATDAVTPNLATGYTRLRLSDLLNDFDPEAEVQDEVWYTNHFTHPARGASAGGGYSTVEDLFDFSRALRGGKLVSPQTHALITAPFNADLVGDAARSFYGYGVQIWDPGTPGERFGHSGGGLGNGAMSLYYPAHDLTVIWLTNQDGAVHVPSPVLKAFLAGPGEEEESRVSAAESPAGL